MGDELYHLASDPREQYDVAGQHPDRIAAIKLRLQKVSVQRPPLGELPILMEPDLPCVYGRDEKANAPTWIKEPVNAIRATHPQHWPPATTSWPQAPKEGKIIYTGDGR